MFTQHPWGNSTETPEISQVDFLFSTHTRETFHCYKQEESEASFAAFW